jgi:hypothetical protein
MKGFSLITRTKMGNFDSLFPVRAKGYAKNSDSRKCIDGLLSSDIARRVLPIMLAPALP